jgi:hypothetical protein
LAVVVFGRGVVLGIALALVVVERGSHVKVNHVS